MHIFSADFALEWPRPLPPNLRLVGPLLPEPAQPLPAELEVRAHTQRGHALTMKGASDLNSPQSRYCHIKPVSCEFQLALRIIAEESLAVTMDCLTNTANGLHSHIPCSGWCLLMTLHVGIGNLLHAVHLHGADGRSS